MVMSCTVSPLANVSSVTKSSSMSGSGPIVTLSNDSNMCTAAAVDQIAPGKRECSLPKLLLLLSSSRSSSRMVRTSSHIMPLVCESDGEDDMIRREDETLQLV